MFLFNIKGAAAAALAVWLVLSAMARANAGEVLAGAAARVVTPDPLLPVSGGIGPAEPVHGKAGELQARALVFEVEGERLAVVSLDFLGFPSALGDRVRELTPEIPGDHILIGATHTHSAPDPYGFPNGRGGVGADLEYLDRVCDLTAEAIREAVDRLAPVRLRVATGNARGRIAYNSYAEALFDPRCSVIQAVQADGAALATLVNYACHPEVLGAGRGLISPDFVGPLYERLAERDGGFGIFMNGALGGMVTADNRREGGEEVHTWEECRRIGRKLADEALRIVEDAPFIESPRLRIKARRVAFPVDSEELRAVMAFSPIDFVVDDRGRAVTTVNLIDLGPARIATIPGEALPNVGAYLKRRLGGEHPMLFGLTNDAFGYILTEEDFRAFPRYAYVSRTSLGERTAGILTQALMAMRRGLEREAAGAAAPRPNGANRSAAQAN